MSPALWTVVGVVGAAGAALAGWYIYRRQMPPLRALDARPGTAGLTGTRADEAALAC